MAKNELFVRELSLLHEFQDFYIRDNRTHPNSLTPLKPYLLRVRLAHSNQRIFSSMHIDALRSQLAGHEPAETPIIAQQWSTTPEGVLAAEEAQQFFDQKVGSLATDSGHLLMRHLSETLCVAAQTISRHITEAGIALSVDNSRRSAPARYIAIPDMAELVHWELPGTPLLRTDGQGSQP